MKNALKGRLKKEHFISFGILCLLGILFIFVSAIGQFRHANVIFASGCAFIWCGLLNLLWSLYWSNTKRQAECSQQERISCNDERKTMLREKSGQIAYGLTLIVLVIVNLVLPLQA